jgi:hypothetical protein
MYFNEFRVYLNIFECNYSIFMVYFNVFQCISMYLKVFEYT